MLKVHVCDGLTLKNINSFELQYVTDDTTFVMEVTYCSTNNKTKLGFRMGTIKLLKMRFYGNFMEIIIIVVYSKKYIYIF